MSQLIASEIVDDSSQFFAPVSSDLIDGLLGQYQQYRKQIDEIAGIATGSLGNAIHYFINGNKDRSSYIPDVSRLFNPKGAIAALDAAYWSKTLGLTDVYDTMPQARRDEWNNTIRDMTAPEFTEEAVRPTISDLLASRQKFFAERVDGIFRGLSGEHVTNAPEAFGKRMIVGYMLSYGLINHSKSGLINDLRCVIAKFMGRGESKHNASDALVRDLFRDADGKWQSVDGGAFRIRVYKKGTAHIEVHPDMAWRLNQVLAGIYPRAIPAKFRQKPKKSIKQFEMMDRPLPFSVLALLEGYSKSETTFSFYPSDKENTVAFNEACRVLASIGGVLTKDGTYEFDYAYKPVIKQIIITGGLPDQKAHQFYPTPESIARIAVDMAQIGDTDTVLEPSAGQGDLADFLPKDRTVCVEISPLHCDILRSRGFSIVKCDFLAWAATAEKFDRVVMNPPFSEGRAMAHVTAAAQLVKHGGRLAAVLPASFKGKAILPDWQLEWSDVYTGEFSGTGVSVVIVSAVRL